MAAAKREPVIQKYLREMRRMSRRGPPSPKNLSIGDLPCERGKWYISQDLCREGRRESKSRDALGFEASHLMSSCSLWVCGELDGHTKYERPSQAFKQPAHLKSALRRLQSGDQLAGEGLRVDRERQTCAVLVKA